MPDNIGHFKPFLFKNRFRQFLPNLLQELLVFHGFWYIPIIYKFNAGFYQKPPLICRKSLRRTPCYFQCRESQRFPSMLKNSATRFSAWFLTKKALFFWDAKKLRYYAACSPLIYFSCQEPPAPGLYPLPTPTHSSF